jgi:crossover junction endodeoxyribonuclease RuvC
MTPVVVGVDLSLTATGMAWPDGTLRTHGRQGLTTIQPPESRAAALDSLARELRMMATGAGAVPDAIALEGLELHSKTSAGLSERCYLWWQFANLCRCAPAVPLVVIPPTSVKLYAVGKGQCTKAAVVDAVARRLPQFETAGNDNEADAGVLCAMVMDLLGHPLVTMPAAHRKALSKLVVPGLVKL